MRTCHRPSEPPTTITGQFHRAYATRPSERVLQILTRKFRAGLRTRQGRAPPRARPCLNYPDYDAFASAAISATYSSRCSYRLLNERQSLSICLSSICRWSGLCTISSRSL